jgi:hypothetical protein
VTRDDIRKLIGGYATGTLTEAERKLLFEAALDDQELFDELSREQALKETLDEPGVLEHLIAALSAPKRKPFNWWPWVVAATAVASVLVVFVLIQLAGLAVLIPFLQRPARQEIAAVRQAPEPAAAPVLKDEPAKTVAPAPPAPANERRETREENKSTAEPAAQAAAESAGQVAAAPTARALRVTAGMRADALAKAKRFAFDYAIDANRRLRVTAASDGYLRVAAAFPEGERVIFPMSGDGRVTGGSVTELEIPDSATELTIGLSAQAGAQAAASRRDAASGTVEDPNPSPESQLSVTVRLRR